MKTASRWFAVSFAILAAVMGGCVNREAQKEGKQTLAVVSDTVKEVTAQPVRVESIEQTLEITGQLTAWQDTVLGPKQGGKLVAVLVGDGDEVHAGQLLATEDTSTLNAQVSQALANLAAAQSQLAQAKANALVGPARSASAVIAAQAALGAAQAGLDKAKAGSRPEERVQAEWQVRGAKSNLDSAQAELVRQKTLFTEGAGTKQQAERAQAAYDSALTDYNAAVQAEKIEKNATRPEDLEAAEQNVKAAREQVNQALDQQKLDVLFNDQVQAAQAAVQAAQAQVTIAQQAVTDAQITAPFDGHISGKPLQPGEIVAPGTPVMRLVGKGGEYFEGQVSENDVANLQLQMPVVVHIDALAGATTNGHVAAIDPVGADFGRNFKVRISLDSPPAQILPGMFARGVVAIKQAPNAVVVPAEAVLTRDGQTIVFIVDGNKARLVKVTTGIQQDDVIQVTGVQAGQVLVTQGQTALVDGSTVRVETNNAVGAPASGNKAA
jgi:RND family efflux transporter MFP subunit